MTLMTVSSGRVTNGVCDVTVAYRLAAIGNSTALYVAPMHRHVANGEYTIQRLLD